MDDSMEDFEQKAKDAALLDVETRRLRANLPQPRLIEHSFTDEDPEYQEFDLSRTNFTYNPVTESAHLRKERFRDLISSL